METVNKETPADKNESNVPHGFFHGYDLGATGNVITALLIAISVFLVLRACWVQRYPLASLVSLWGRSGTGRWLRLS